MKATIEWNNAGRLARVLDAQGIKGMVTAEHKGPRVVRYDFTPADSVRVERIAYLEQTLAVALHAPSVRVSTGAGCVAIEVAKATADAVNLADLLESAAWQQSTAKVPLPIGVDVAGNPIVADLTECPHLLIAGATGSGKSVALNSMILSMCGRLDPNQLRVLLIDPKVVEFQGFSNLPHLVAPPINSASDVLAALDWLIAEMAARYKAFSRLGVRNLAAYNQSSRSEDRLPYLVAVIDELADLMLIAKSEFETGIARLAQLARAAGIHLIVATQRPSVNVVTGIIKANLPSRLAFRVVSQVDSRVILDSKGAESLLGKGDGLWMGPGMPAPVRVQGCYVSDADMQREVAALAVEAPVYLEAAQAAIEAGTTTTNEEGTGTGPKGLGCTPAALVDDAVNVLRDYGVASTAGMAWALRVGNETARTVLDILADRGWVSKAAPGSPDAPREILIRPSV